MLKKRSISLTLELWAVVIFKLLAIYIIWFLFFSDHPHLDVQDVSQHLLNLRSPD